MRIALLGVRSVPGRYGGFDTVATELAPRLAARGFDVTVYCQRRYVPPPRDDSYRGVRLVHLPAFRRQALEETSHEILSLAHAATRRFDALYVFGLRATLFFAPAAAAGMRIFFNTDGHDWQRRKWGPGARRYLLISERVGVRIARDRLIADSKGIAAYFQDRYGVTPTFIPYGAPTVADPDPAALQPYGLEPGGYYLVLCRLEPENNIDAIIEGHARSRTTRPLIIVGGVNYDSPYIERLRSTATERVRFLGAIYEPGVVDALYRFSYAYLHGHEVGGTNPALLHAIGAGATVLANDVIYNREVLGDAGRYWSATRGDLAATIDALDADEPAAKTLGEEARTRAATEYDWEDVADRYAGYFRERVVPKRRRGRR